MAIKKIVTIPNKILTTKTEKVKKIDSEITELINNLRDTLNSAREPEGAGLAATQIGSNKRICIVRNFQFHSQNPTTNIYEEFVLINPKIVSLSKGTNTDWEGCLSVPDTYGKVQRHNDIKVVFETITGEKIKIKALDYFARVIQHEIDHLDGVIFTDKVIGETINDQQMQLIADEIL